MKFLSSQLAYLLSDRETRANIRALVKYLLFLAALVLIYAVLFHVIKQQIEGEQHSWVTGFYWTLVVMTTLGFGDITFESDVGRLFSIVVLLSGVVFLLVMLPFLFIRLFYAPWLEARVRLTAPRRVPAGTRGHVIMTELDAIAEGLVDRLQSEEVPYFVIEPDPATAARLVGDGLSVIAGDNDSGQTYEMLEAQAARLLLANCTDTTNTNITITAREIAPALPIVAIVEEEDSVDILELSGATTVLPLKHQLGEYLANRVDVGRIEAHLIGSYRGLQIAELPAHDTPFAGLTVRDTRLRERTGVSVAGLWERGRLRPAFPQTIVRPDGVMVVAGTAPQIAALNDLLPRDSSPSPPVLVIGAGKVGQAAARSLKHKGVPVHAIDRSGDALQRMREYADRVFEGDANDRRLVDRAGIGRAASVLLTTNDDAMNIYLAVYCRRLNPELRIVSRITHERNVEAIHRAGADFVLSYTTLGIEAVMSVLRGYELVVLGEGVELFSVPVPASLAGHPLRESGIGSRTGLSVVALQRRDELLNQLTAETELTAGSTLLMLGSLDQRRTFAELFEKSR
ncbi:MAG TPA: NAD-binding protein [Vicinamibacterales bacterium]|nr:NAD-binding protein [Vicinamibacterales bacterium]